MHDRLPITSAAEQFRVYIAALRAYFVFVVLEVVIAPRPAVMHYAPLDVNYRRLWGGVLSLL